MKKFYRDSTVFWGLASSLDTVCSFASILHKSTFALQISEILIRDHDFSGSW